MTALHWGAWDEVIALGAPEWKAIALAHAIILGIAVARFAVIPWLRAHLGGSSAVPSTSARQRTEAAPLAEGCLVDRSNATDP